jgi:hypothetical protein
MSISRWSCVALIATGPMLVACSGGSGGGAPGDAGSAGDSTFPSDGGAAGDSGGGGADSASTGDGSGDSGAVGDGSSGDGGGAGACGNSPDAGGLPYTGIVELSRVNVPPAPVRWEGIALITTAPTPPPPTGCSGTQVGSCCYGTTPSSTTTPESAGNVTIDDGANTIATLTPPGYAATSATTPAFTWTPGSTLKATAAGATVDGFTASVVAPALFAGVTPTLTGGITVSRSADFVLSWTPSKEACSEVSFGLSQGTSLPYIECVVDDSAGTVTVPKSLLSMLTATTGSATLERVEGKRLVTTNAGIGIVALDVLQVAATYGP